MHVCTRIYVNVGMNGYVYFHLCVCVCVYVCMDVRIGVLAVSFMTELMLICLYFLKCSYCFRFVFLFLNVDKVLTKGDASVSFSFLATDWFLLLELRSLQAVVMTYQMLRRTPA